MTMSDVRGWNGAHEMNLGGAAYDDPRMHIEPGIMFAQAVFQQLGCAHCGRVRQWTTWTIRCMGCEREPTVFEACEDCGREKAAWERYNAHVHAVHDDFLPR
jgi:hypothetical protein